MELAVYNISGKKTDKKVKLSKSVFEMDPNNHAIYLDVKQYLANQRQGTHKSKERGEITGSTRKIKKQKGTGTARAGSIKNPLFRSGGRVFGPQPRDYSFKLNKKLKKEYKKVFSMIDYLIFMKVPSFKMVFKWRLLQESKLKKSMNFKKKIMSFSSIKRFIMFYQRITLQMVKDLSKSASIVIMLNKNHEIKKVLYK